MSRRRSTKNLVYSLFLTLCLGGFFAFFAPSVWASTTDGTIDATYKYAWGENIGWVNFGCDNCNVQVTDSGLSGHALSETMGWIDVNDIVIDDSGNLSGLAWSENAGWINFDPTNGGVTINSSGEFTGSALGENVGWIIFGGDYPATTDYRPRSARPACINALDDDSDGQIDYPADPGCASTGDSDETDSASASSGGGAGGGLSTAAYADPTAPAGGFGLLVNGNAAETTSRRVTLTLNGGSDTASIWISESPEFPEGYQTSYDASQNQLSVTFTLSDTDGAKTVYAKFCTAWGRCSEIVSANITLNRPRIVEEITDITQDIAEQISQVPEVIIPAVTEFLQPIVPEILKLAIPEFLRPQVPVVALPEVAIEDLVSKTTPLVFQDTWSLLPQEAIREFVLAPLPSAIINLAQKFPTLEKTFEDTGIAKMTDVAKLQTVTLTLPGLTERVGLPTTQVAPGKFAVFQSIPVANLSLLAKQQMPSEIVFAKTGGELIDFNLAFSVTANGEPQEKITTISGKPLQLAVKPDHPVESVRGYLVFKSRGDQSATLDLPFQSLLTSVIFAKPVLAKAQEKPVRVEEKLVLLEFEYTDPDGDGIYTAEIQAPVMEGEYEIITVLDFEDPELGNKEIRLTTVIDPEGYVYEKAGGKETRIPGAIISIFRLNPTTKQYELWPADDYQQENPQTTDVRGTYSFLVPEGYYYLQAETPGYLVFTGKPFSVTEGSGVHMNIELKTKFGWLKIVDWKTTLLVIVIILLCYNFYRDKLREKLPKAKKV